MSTYVISDQISLSDISSILKEKKKISLSEPAKQRIVKCRNYLDRKMAAKDAVFYGVNTGFGSLCNTQISHDELEQLQENLILSHACGTGNYVEPNIVKLMLLLKVQSLSYGHSGVQLLTVERLIDFFNLDIIPVIYEQGSLGASGDLAPLAHLCLPLIGKGQIWLYDGKDTTPEIAGGELIAEKYHFSPLKLQSKEGLALINGTQFMLAYGIMCLLQAKKLSAAADQIASVSFDAFDCRPEPFHSLLHQIRPHKGQVETAEVMRSLLTGSEISEQNKTQVQDPYSFRCIPQVHGASKDSIAYVEKVFITEANSVTDNPNIFPEEDQILSGGNFHGQPLALSLDFLAIALAELGSISERRTYQLISGQRGLPPFLAKDPGLHSGMMIPQYTAASMVSQNKQLCTPASVDSIVSSNGQEDHVSMGANAATKCLQVVNNLEKILAIELMNAAQALEFRRPLKSSPLLEKIIADYRKKVSFMEKDRALYLDMNRTVDFLNAQ